MALLPSHMQPGLMAPMGSNPNVPMMNILPMGFGLPGLSVHNGLATSEVGFLFNLKNICKILFISKEPNIE